MHQPELLPMLSSLPNGFGYWLAGLTDGEGCFYIHAKDRFYHGYRSQELGLRFEIKLRDDDRHVLEYICNTTKSGRLIDLTPGNSDRYKRRPQTLFRVSRVSELLFIIVPIFEQYTLRTKKAREFELWKEIVALKYKSLMCRRSSGRVRNRPYLSSSDWKHAKEIEHTIRKEIRTYQGRSKWQIT